MSKDDKPTCPACGRRIAQRSFKRTAYMREYMRGYMRRRRAAAKEVQHADKR